MRIHVSDVNLLLCIIITTAILLLYHALWPEDYNMLQITPIFYTPTK